MTSGKQVSDEKPAAALDLPFGPHEVRLNLGIGAGGALMTTWWLLPYGVPEPWRTVAGWVLAFFPALAIALFDSAESVRKFWTLLRPYRLWLITGTVLVWRAAVSDSAFFRISAVVYGAALAGQYAVRACKNPQLRFEWAAATGCFVLPILALSGMPLAVAGGLTLFLTGLAAALVMDRQLEADHAPN